MRNELVDQLMASSELPELLEELNQRWEAEQRRRHQFWDEISDDVKAEFINGQAVYHSPVKKMHNACHQNILFELFSFNRQHQSGFVGFEKMLCRFTRNDYEPDICFWLKEQADSFTEDQYVFPVPDFIVEILSRKTEKNDRGVKLQDYQAHGVAEYWIIDPRTRMAEQYLLSGSTYNPPLKLKTGTLHSRVIAGFSMDVEAIFA